MKTETDRDTIKVSESWRVTIVTKYHGNSGRISVTTGDGTRKRIYVPWNHSLNTGENHAAAIKQYVTLMGWGGHWITGGTDTGAVAVWAGYVEDGQ